MRLRNVKNKEKILESCDILISESKAIKGNWKKVFENNNPIYIEIGMGKGDFIIENALRYPNINFIGIEKYDSVLARAIEKLPKNINDSITIPESTLVSANKMKSLDELLKNNNACTAEVIVTYKFTVKNNGELIGYVDSLVDDLPSGLEFSSELNKDWYKGSDGKLYTTAFSGKAINPGQTSEIELILTKDMTEDNVGVFVNSASLEKVSNLEGIAEKEDAKENNQSSAELFISIKTGSAILYTGITISCILIIAAGAYVIKKKVLNKGI